MDEDQIRSELEDEMRHLMTLSGQRKFFGHKHFQPTEATGSSGAIMWTDAASNMMYMMYIAVRCVIGVSARSVAEL